MVLFFSLLVGVVIGIGIERFRNNIHRQQRRAYWRGRNFKGTKQPSELKAVRSTPQSLTANPTSTEAAANQLRAVMGADFKPRALLNKPERRLLDCIDRVLADESPGWRAMGQVSLGEVLYSQDKDAFWAINAKRVDLLIIDRDCRPLHAVEFQGTGHHGSPETAARDAVKKEALRRAGIGYVEVISGDTPAQVREMVRKLVGRTNIQP